MRSWTLGRPLAVAMADLREGVGEGSWGRAEASALLGPLEDAEDTLRLAALVLA